MSHGAWNDRLKSTGSVTKCGNVCAGTAWQPAFLLIAVAVSATYLPAMISTNVGLLKRLQIRKSRYVYLAGGL